MGFDNYRHSSRGRSVASAIEFKPPQKPAALQAGYAPGRTDFGEQFHRAAYALAALTGNVGIPGGSSGSSNGATGRAGVRMLATGKNPIEARVSSPLLADLLVRGKEGGYPADIKLIYSVGGDLFNQCPNLNKMMSALDGVEFIVGQDNFLTPTARYADIVLPATTFWERNDVHTPWAGALHYAIFMRQAIAPMYECRNDLDIFVDLAARLGIDGYSDKSEMAWLKELTADAVDDFDAFGQRRGRALPGAWRTRSPSHERSATLEKYKFSTPSGRISRDLLDGAGGQSRPVWAGTHPADPDLDTAGTAGGWLSAGTVHPQIARPHAFDPRQSAAFGAG